MDTQVLIVGAGPTGLTLAGELRRRGVDSILIDSLDEPLSWDRATIVHPRTMELLAGVGLDTELDATGVHQRYIHIYSDGEKLGEMDLSENGSPFGYNVNVSEEVTERILAGHLHAHGGHVQHGRRLIALTQLEDRVIATVRHGGEDHEVSAEWIVGCGGLHSPVRELSGIDFDGHDIAEPWAVLDTTLAGWPHGHVSNFAFLDRGSVILTPLPEDRWRAYIRPSSPASDLVDDAARVIQRYAPGASLTDIANPTRFHCHTKVAAQYRQGRALLAGDAAHVCSPSQGHGMNTGIQDSFNLAWKLALVCRGEADDRLLDTYESERRPVASAMTRSGDDFDRSQTLLDDEERAERDSAIRATFADPAARHDEILAESELDIGYEDSGIVSGPAGRGAGLRLPGGIRLSDAAGDITGHTVLVLGRDPERTAEVMDAIASEVAGAADAVVTMSPEDHPVLAGLGEPDAEVTIVVVRPDHYIGHISVGPDAAPVRAYFELVRSGGR